MVKSQVYTTPKRKNAKPKNKSVPRQVTLAPVTRAVVASGPTKQAQVELVLPVRKGAGSFTLHPSNIAWLKAVAPSHQEWTLSNLRVWYEPRAGSTTSGTVALGFLQDFSDTVPASLDSIIRLSGSKRGAPWTPSVFNVPKPKWYQYLKGDDFAALSATDKNTRAVGRIVYFADTDTDASMVLGNILISYVPTLSLRYPTDPSTQ